MYPDVIDRKYDSSEYNRQTDFIRRFQVSHGRIKGLGNDNTSKQSCTILLRLFQ